MLPLIQMSPDKKLILFGMVCYALIVLSILLSPLSFWIQLALIALFLFKAIEHSRCLLFLTASRAVRGISCTNREIWQIYTHDKQLLQGILKSNSLVTRFLIVLNFECEFSLRLTAVVTPTSIGLQEFRRLVVFLTSSMPA